LLTGLDLPWVADGIQRDGPQARIAVDSRLRAVLDAQGIAYTAIDGPQRLALAMQTIALQV
jgi:nicotinamide riboside kinase